LKTQTHPVHVAAGQAFLSDLTLFRVAVFTQGNRRCCPDQNDCTIEAKMVSYMIGGIKYRKKFSAGSSEFASKW
jgi:hypothetical protein